MARTPASKAKLRVPESAKTNRKRVFLDKLNQNLANADPVQQDHLVDEFRDLILGR